MSHQTAWVRVPLPLPVFLLCFPIRFGSTLKCPVFIAHDLSGFAFLSALTEGARRATEVSAENRRAPPLKLPPVSSWIARLASAPATPRLKKLPPSADRSECSVVHPSARTESRGTPPAFRAKASSRSATPVDRVARCCRDSPRARAGGRNPIQVPPARRYERRPALHGRHRKAPIELPHVLLAQEAVGFLHSPHSRQTQLLRQPPLPSPEVALAAPPRLRRVGRDHLNSQLFHRPPHLRQPVEVDLLPGLGRLEEVTRPIAVQ